MATPEAGYDPADWVDLYVRKSTKVTGHRAELSTDAQEALGREWAKREGLRVRKVWKDIASGFKDVARPDYDKALKAVQERQVGTLWCFRLDRWSRKGARSVLDIIDPEDGVPRRLIFHGDYLDSSQQRDRRQIINRAEDAREESERTSFRVRETKNYQRDHGMWASGRPPYGMRVNRLSRQIEPDDDPFVCVISTRTEWSRAQVAERWFLEAIGDEDKDMPPRSTRKIATGLNADGIPASQGGKWSPQVIYQRLLNPVYAGWQVTRMNKGHGIPTRYLKEDGTSVKCGTGIITDEQQQTAVDTIKGHRITHMDRTGSGQGKAKHLLTGLLRCEGCARRMPCTGKSYSCVAYKAGKPCPRRASASRAPLEAWVAHLWLAQLTNAEPDDPIMIAVAERWTALTRPHEAEEEKQARTALKRAEADLEQLLKDRQAGVYKGPAARYFAPLLEEATKAVTEAQATLRRVGGAGVDISFLMEEESAREAWKDADLALKRDLLRLAIDRITVSKVPEGDTVAKNSFRGWERVAIDWAKPTPDDDEDDAADD